MISEIFYNMTGICIIISGTIILILYAIDIVGGIKEIIKEKRQAKLSGKTEKPQREVKTNGTKPETTKGA